MTHSAAGVLSMVMALRVAGPEQQRGPIACHGLRGCGIETHWPYTGRQVRKIQRAVACQQHTQSDQRGGPRRSRGTKKLARQSRISVGVGMPRVFGGPPGPQLRGERQVDIESILVEPAMVDGALCRDC